MSSLLCLYKNIIHLNVTFETAVANRCDAIKIMIKNPQLRSLPQLYSPTHFVIITSRDLPTFVIQRIIIFVNKTCRSCGGVPWVNEEGGMGGGHTHLIIPVSPQFSLKMIIYIRYWIWRILDFYRLNIKPGQMWMLLNRIFSEKKTEIVNWNWNPS